VPYIAADKKRGCSKRVDRTNSGVVAWASVAPSEPAFAQALAHNPLVVTVAADDFQHYAGGVFDCNPGSPPNHAITLVAYNTNWQGPDGGWRDGAARPAPSRQPAPPLRAICMRGVQVAGAAC
jgi:hypothetical protein